MDLTQLPCYNLHPFVSEKYAQKFIQWVHQESTLYDYSIVFSVKKASDKHELKNLLLL